MTAIEADPTFVVRDATDADAEAVARVFAHYVTTSTATFETEPRTADQWRALWRTLHESGWPRLVGVLAGQVVGFAYISPWRGKPAYRHTVETTVYLAPDATGHGFGRELSRRLLDAAAANGAREVIAVIADTGNPASRGLHRALGFRDVGTLESVGHKLGRWIDVCLMQKSLRNAERADAVREQIARELLVDVSFDPQTQIERRVTFLVDALRNTGRAALVLGVSGGVDSAVAGRLCQLAVERVRAGGHQAVFIAMRLPYGKQRDEADAHTALAFIGPDRTLTIDVGPASDAGLRALTASGFTLSDPSAQDFVLGNIKARERMIVQYAVAGAGSGLVVGTDHAAEAVTGFFTKHGDGAADVIPLAGLTKRRVRAIARELGAPDALVHKTPTADLETLAPGKPDEDALGLTYDEIDDFLEGRPVQPEAVEAIIRGYRETAHKRQPPSGPQLRT